jgi:uncharacterized protein
MPAQRLGVGMYQHSMDEGRLEAVFDQLVEDCVSEVGVDLNLASTFMLTRVPGVGSARAAAIVKYRNEHGLFESRDALLKVPGVGRVTVGLCLERQIQPRGVSPLPHCALSLQFNQAVGFLRVNGGSDPLDCTGIHPESRPAISLMLQSVNCSLATPAPQLATRIAQSYGLGAVPSPAEVAGTPMVRRRAIKTTCLNPIF